MEGPRENAGQDHGFSRRTMIAALTTGAAVALANAGASAQEGHNHHGAHADHDAHADHGEHHHGGPKHQMLIEAALDCVNRGETCVGHCLSLLGKGDTQLKDCMQSVLTMMPAVSALARLAALDAKRLGEFAEVCADICADCEAECKKHQDHHSACKACAESCATCVEECRKVI